MLVSTEHQHESSIGMFTHVPSHLNIAPTSRLLPSPHLSTLSHTANSHWLSVLHMVRYVSMLPSYRVLREINAQEKIENKKSRATLFIYILYNYIFIIIT